jgi:prevent-host-death family protein
MVRLSALAAKTRFGEALDLALQGPVEIEKHGRRVAVLVSAREYDRLSALDALGLDRRAPIRNRRPR